MCSTTAVKGHLEPFDLRYVAVGNEDCGKKNYREDAKRPLYMVAVLPAVYGYSVDVESLGCMLACSALKMETIYFVKSNPVESSEQCSYPDVPSFLEYVHSRQVICVLSDLDICWGVDLRVELTYQTLLSESCVLSHKPNIYVLDTPGVLVSSIRDIETGLKLALAGSWKMEANRLWECARKPKEEEIDLGLKFRRSLRSSIRKKYHVAQIKRFIALGVVEASFDVILAESYDPVMGYSNYISCLCYRIRDGICNSLSLIVQRHSNGMHPSITQHYKYKLQVIELIVLELLNSLPMKVADDSRLVLHKMVESFLNKFFFPSGYPYSVNEGFLRYTQFRSMQHFTSAALSVLSTQVVF
ncbi:hypothetical protein RHMOL_Rhmol06G0133400 [Rhododendron molle]|uniref:Uncharacterized protein n=1 Tax=Rhododendron molle TaxID=49168 RepID=A0ACC0NBR9_RHOML|nr:hypothetical protein RHMOL_Rhmol06G0133400 [Rhododendron molle]